MADQAQDILSKDTHYKTLSEDFRSLNGFFWQIPLIMMTLNGGLWFSVANLEISDGLRQYVLWFAGIANIAMIFALWRLRTVMGNILKQMRAIEGRQTAEGGGYIAWVFSGLLGLAAIGAFVAGGSPATFFLKRVAAAASGQ